MDITIENASTGDEPRIREILSVYNMGEFGHSEREKMPEIGHFTVRDRGRIVGCAAFLLHKESKLTINDRQAETGSLAVIPEYRGTGLGYRLQVARMLRMRGLGIETLFTETDTPQNINWYIRKFDYVNLHTREKTYNFGDPAINTFSLLVVDLKRWGTGSKLRQLLDNTADLMWTGLTAKGLATSPPFSWRPDGNSLLTRQ